MLIRLMCFTFNASQGIYFSMLAFDVGETYLRDTKVNDMKVGEMNYPISFQIL